jgi:hypothetical protein
VEVTLEIDYGRWFQALDVQNDTPSALKQAIVGQIAKSFQIYSITFSS